MWSELLGKKLNEKRIPSYIEAIKAAVNMYPMNNTTKMTHHLQEQKEVQESRRPNKPGSPTYAGIVKETPSTENRSSRGGYSRLGNNMMRSRGRGGRGRAIRGRRGPGGYHGDRQNRETARTVKKYVPVQEDELTQQYKFSNPEETRMDIQDREDVD